MTSVSIVTVVRNDLLGLTKTGQSLASQTLHDLEWIVIDGASTGANQVTKDLLTPSPAIFVSEPDAGIYDAMNKGWKLASGEWIMFLNAGDTLCQDRTLEDVIPRLNESSAQWAFGMVRNVDRDGKVIGIQNASPFNRMGQALGNTTVPHQATFIRRQLLADLGGFDPAFGMAADQELIYRAARYFRPEELVWPVSNFALGGLGMQVPDTQVVRLLRKARYRDRALVGGSLVVDLMMSALVFGRKIGGRIAGATTRG